MRAPTLYPAAICPWPCEHLQAGAAGSQHKLEPGSIPEALTGWKRFHAGADLPVTGLGWQYPLRGEGMWQAGLSHCTVKQDRVVPGLWEELSLPA